VHERSEIELLQLSQIDARTAEEIAAIHVAGLPYSINSLRGAKVVAWLYQELAKSGHRIYVARHEGKVVAVLALVDSEVTLFLQKLARREPLQWLRLASTKFVQISRLMRDAKAVERPRRRAGNHFYIASLAVADDHRRLGIARRLIDSVLEVARMNHRAVFVDTHRDNVVARRFYEQVGFVQVAETKLSVVYRW